MDFTVIVHNITYFLIGAYPNGFLGGAALTILLSMASSIISAILGLIFGVILAVTKGLIHQVLVIFLGFFRAIPVIMLIFWVYFLLPILFNIDIPGTFTVVCSLSLIGGAYLAHAVYAGIRSLPAGQWQAGAALGMKPFQVLRYIILPQALPIMMPSFINQWVSLIKDTSLAYVIGVPELSFVATQVSNRVMVYPAEIFLFVAVVYYIYCVGLSFVANSLLKRYQSKTAL